MEIQNSFNKGLNKDLSVALHQPDTYYDMHNMRLVTTEGLSTGNPVNIKGTENVFKDSSQGYTNIFKTSNVVLITGVPTNNIEIVSVNGVLISFLFNSEWEKNLSTAINAASLPLSIISAYKTDRVVVYMANGNSGNIIVLPLASTLIVNNNYVPAFDTLDIMGWEVIRDELFIFTTNDPTIGYGQLWKFTYDPISPFTNPRITILYNNAIDLSMDHPIANPGAIIGNYEGTQIKKLYWSDNNNSPRSINTADINLMALDPNLLDLQSLIKYSIPILQNVQKTGSLKTGLYQYAYRLLMNTGQESVYSQCSSLIPVNSHDEANESYIKYLGVPSGANSGKSLTLSINNLDTNYDRVQIVSLYYSNPSGTPIIQIIKNEPVPDNGIYTFVHTGSEIGIDVTLDEFNIINTKILKAKTLTSKNNYLFLGNIKESNFDVDYDARAYRFNSVNTSEVIDKLGGSLTVNPLSSSSYPDQWGITEEYDSINPNQDPNSIGLNTNPDPYLYQYDPLNTGSLIFGGSGPNITYRFVPDEVDLTGVTTLNGQSIKLSTQTWLDTQSVLPHTNDGARAPVFQVQRHQNTYKYDNYTRINQGDTFFDFHSPYLEAQLKGYTRGEVYRFGIVFFDTNGNQSYVKWIGDIQFPHVFMPDPNDPLNPAHRKQAFNVTRIEGITTSANNLGILFTINNIPDGVSGFSIVRCERTSEDKTVLGQGLFQVAFQTGFCADVYLVDDGMQQDYVSSGIIGNGVSTSANSSFAANPGTNIRESAVDGRYTSTFIPEHLFGTEDFSFKTGDQIELISKLDSVDDWFRASYNNAGANACDTTYSFSRKIFYTKNYAYNSNLLYDVANQGNSTYNGYFPLRGTRTFDQWASSAVPVPENDVYYLPGGQFILNLSPPRNILTFGVPSFQGCDTNLLSQGIKTLVTTSANYSIFGSTGLNRAQTDGILGTNSVYLCNYKRVPALQYGGNSYSERSDSQYISTGHYQGCIPNLGTYETIVYGGDTYINIFDISPRMKHFTQGDNYDNFSTDISPRSRLTPSYPYMNISPSSQVQRYFPVESTVNIDLRQTTQDIDYVCGQSSIPTVCIPNKTNYDDVSTPLGTIQAKTPDIEEEFIYNTLYSRDNNTRKFYPKSTQFLSDGVYDVRVRASQKKTNNEQVDSWTQFKAADYLDIDTIQGPITNLMVHQDRLLAFQEKGISVLSVEERSLINDVSGASLVLGTGGILTRFDYISKIIGSRHQFGFTQSNDCVFFFDMNTKNLYKLQGNSPVSLSVAKGLSSFFGNNLNGEIQVTDNPYRNKGITCTYDFHYNEGVFTFKDIVNDIPYNFSISFNDFIEGFQSTYFGTLGNDIQPIVYINDKKNIFSSGLHAPRSSEDYRQLWLLDSGDYGSFFNIPNSSNFRIQPSKITLLVNQDPGITKVFDNWQLTSESTNAAGINVPDDTFNHIRVYTENQDSGIQDLPGTTKIIGKRVERSWNIGKLRSRSIYNTQGLQTGVSATDILFGERFRGKYMFVDLIYDNLNNNKLVLNTFKTQVRLSPR